MALRTNLATNPRGTSATWVRIAGPSGTSAISFVGSGGPTPPATFARVTWSVATTAAGGGIVSGASNANRAAVATGTQYTASMYVRASLITRVQCQIVWYDSGGSVLSTDTTGTQTVLAANTWTRLSDTATAPANAVAASVQVVSVTGTSFANFGVGATLDGSGLLFEAASSVGTYFDGSFAAAGGWLYAWNATADASASTAAFAEIILTPQTSSDPRVGVQVDGWSTPRNGTIKVYRVHPDTSEYEVRGSQSGGGWATSNGAAFAWDYEAPLGLSVTYYAMDGSTRVNSTSTSLAVTSAWLKSPGSPGNDLAVKVIGKPEQLRSRPAVILEPIGRENPIVIMDARKGSRFKLTVRTKTDAEATAILRALKLTTTVLLLMPGVRDSWRYIAVTDHVEHPVVDYRPPTGAAANHVASWSDWELTCIVTDRPVGGVFGDPTAAYSVVLSTYATYTALKSAKASYLEVLKGV